MTVVNTSENMDIKDELYYQYNWYMDNFLHKLRNAADEFFEGLFTFELVSVSKNINILFSGDDYFVTKVRIDKQHDVFFRCSSDGIKLILDRTLGANRKFNIADITELEAKIISSFNDYLYGAISSSMLPSPPQTLKRKNFDTVNLTFFIKDTESNEGAKYIVSLPLALLSPRRIKPHSDVFSVLDFKNSPLTVKIKVGTTKFCLKEIKNLEKDDIVIFEKSNINFMRICYEDFEKEFKINPNLGLMLPIDDDNGGNNMEQGVLSQDLWDNIQVEMGAEFDSVKITLGELKSIEQGLVLDLASVYDNRVSLKVENKIIASGELVIINDRYGVRIDEVYASEKTAAPALQQDPAEVAEITEHPVSDVQESASDSVASQQVEEEFDYSDFELDEQDI